ncbi:GNAT family N-acetyltransferase [Streptomyces rubiginosohelvolus]|uniref:GNAT family N-acetyltransferase n=1 Tax=Streptomyces rubiginosohelvolus TaxID=67362 RepID=UPI0033A31E39
MPAADDTTYEIRTATPEDTGLVEALDGSFTTATIFHVETAENGFTLRETAVDPPLTKVFPADEDEEEGGDDEEGGDEEEGGDSGAEGDQEPQGDPTFLAVAPDGSLAGFVSVAYARWNRRLTIEDIEVAPGHRGRGVGRALMSRAEEFARERGAGHIWLEVTNINAPAIHAYRRMGFALCGLDTSLYEFTASSGEYALYLSKPCR